MQLLRDNLTLWTSDGGDVEEDRGEPANAMQGSMPVEEM